MQVHSLYVYPVKSLAGIQVSSLSRYCGQAFRFVFMPEETFRRVDTGRVTEYRRVSFADGFPFLIVNLASLEELNSRLDSVIEVRRFRPNIVVEGAKAWDEDDWTSARIGDTGFTLVKPCSRCVVTTVDPDRGVSQEICSH